MSSQKDVYKVGDCFIAKHSQQIYEIVELITSKDGIKIYTVKKIDKEYQQAFRINHSTLLTYFEYSPVARVLYNSKV